MNRIRQTFIRPRGRWQAWLLVLLGLGLIGAWVVVNGYLNVQRMILGRELLRLQEENYNLQVSLAALRTQLAQAQSYTVMAEHARALGFRPASPAQVIYVPVPLAAPAALHPQEETLALPLRHPAPWERPAYRETLWEWLSRNLWLPSGGLP